MNNHRKKLKVHSGGFRSERADVIESAAIEVDFPNGTTIPDPAAESQTYSSSFIVTRHRSFPSRELKTTDFPPFSKARAQISS